MVSSSKSGIDKLLEMQKELMEKVRHELRPDVYSSVVTARNLFERTLLYLNSLGHKPWRPQPLAIERQNRCLRSVGEALSTLKRLRSLPTTLSLEGDRYDKVTRRLISAFGIIEETLEYLDAADYPEKDRKYQLEELTGILFFYLELTILGKFTWAEIEEEYARKWEVNMERYRRAKEGDYSWDKRDEGRL